jgi:hypothetical protein
MCVPLLPVILPLLVLIINAIANVRLHAAAAHKRTRSCASSMPSRFAALFHVNTRHASPGQHPRPQPAKLPLVSATRSRRTRTRDYTMKHAVRWVTRHCALSGVMRRTTDRGCADCTQRWNRWATGCVGAEGGQAVPLWITAREFVRLVR